MRRVWNTGAATILFAWLGVSGAYAQGASGSVSGKLVATGQAHGFEGVHVELRDLYQQAQRSFGQQKALSITPDADGNFFFPSVQPGVWTLEASGANFLRMQWGANGPEMVGNAVVVVAGQARSGMDIPLVMRQIVCGTVFGANGQPVQGMKVAAWITYHGNMTQDNQGKDGDDGGNTLTDAEGRYRFDHLQPGRYLLAASHPNPGMDEQPTWLSDTPHSELSTSLVVGPATDEVCRYDFHFPAQPFFSADAARGGVAVSGRITGPLERQFEPYMLMLQRTGSPFRTDNIMRFGSIAADGSFQAQDVPPGTYTITVEGGEQMCAGGCPTNWLLAKATVTVGTSNVTDVVLPLLELAVVKGTASMKNGGALPLHQQWLASGVQNVPGTARLGNPRFGGTESVIASDGSFELAPMDARTWDFRAGPQNLESREYVAGVTVDGKPLTETGKIALHGGVNRVQVTLADDAGIVEVPAGNLGNLAELLLVPSHAVADGSEIIHGQSDGQIVRAYAPPGEYRAVLESAQAGLFWMELEELFGGSDVPEPEYVPEYLRRMVTMGVPVHVPAGGSVHVSVPDMTVQLQNVRAELGVPIDSW